MFDNHIFYDASNKGTVLHDQIVFLPWNLIVTDIYRFKDTNKIRTGTEFTCHNCTLFACSFCSTIIKCVGQELKNNARSLKCAFLWQNEIVRIKQTDGVFVIVIIFWDTHTLIWSHANCFCYDRRGWSAFLTWVKYELFTYPNKRPKRYGILTSKYVS